MFAHSIHHLSPKATSCGKVVATTRDVLRTAETRCVDPWHVRRTADLEPLTRVFLVYARNVLANGGGHRSYSTVSKSVNGSFNFVRGATRDT